MARRTASQKHSSVGILLLILGLIVAVAAAYGVYYVRTVRPQQVAAYTYQRPYGDAAPWNRQVVGLPLHPQATLYRDRLWKKSIPRYKTPYLQ